MLVEGLRRHVTEMGERGVTNDEINAMEQAVKELEAVNEEVDRIREQLTPTVAKLKVAMNRVKEAYVEDTEGSGTSVSQTSLAYLPLPMTLEMSMIIPPLPDMI